jgi:hypothetical protein
MARSLHDLADMSVRDGLDMAKIPTKDSLGDQLSE